MAGPWGRVLELVRTNDRCPARHFLAGLDHKFQKKFRGSFDAVTKQQGYENQQRFKPLHRDGKPLWEFKEHDHRLYCARWVGADGRAEIVLLNGWVKDKEGKTEKENRAIGQAQDLYHELLAELSGGKNE